MSNEVYNFCLLGKAPAFQIKCDCCGKTSIVSDEHKRYCPVCGPDVITPIEVSKYREETRLTEDFIEEAKELAEAQYYKGLENDFAGTIGFDFKGQWIAYPWIDQSARFPLSTEEAIATYGKDNFEKFCISIIRDNNEKKVQGYDNSPVKHTGII